MNEIIEKLEEEELSADDHNETPPSDIIAYNELRSCADLFRMHEEGVLDIQPEFQRDFIWQGTAQTRFIDSLIKQLPIPSMCFAYDYQQSQWIVIDGLQRISTIIRFLGGSDWKLSQLDDIDPQLAGKNAATLKTSKNELRIFYTRVQNQTIPINVLRCDFRKKSHNEYLFTIFHRLNSGGAKLNNQEIRNCIYSGKFNNLLKSLDLIAEWRSLNNMAEGQNYRFAKQEAILRFFAFLENRTKYNGSVAKFLNDFMFSNRLSSDEDCERRRSIFTKTIGTLTRMFPNGLPARTPGTVLEAAMIGIAVNIGHVETQATEHLQDSYERLRAHKSLSAAYLAEGLSKKDKVDSRLTTSIEFFSN